MAKIKIYGIPSISFLLMLVASCAPKAGIEPKLLNISPSKETSIEKAAWEVEWENTIAQGKKEGKVAIYANLGKELIEAWRKPLSQKYSINLEFLTGRSTELAEKALSERRAGLYLVDVFIGGATTSTYLKKKEVTAPSSQLLILPEVTSPVVWWEGKLPFLDKEGHILAFRASPNTPLVINSQIVKPSELKAYKDLLNPKWKGKIVINDPTIAGSGHDIFYLVGKNIYDLEYWKEMVKLEPVISRDQRFPVEWVARGKYAVGIGLKADVITEFKNAGSPLESLLPSEGTYITPGAGTFLLMDKAPHPQATKVFVNWLLTRESLEIMSRTQMVQSSRVDIPTDFLPAEEIRDPRVKYYSQHTEEALIEKDRYSEIAKEVFAPILK